MRAACSRVPLRSLPCSPICWSQAVSRTRARKTPERRARLGPSMRRDAPGSHLPSAWMPAGAMRSTKQRASTMRGPARRRDATSEPAHRGASEHHLQAAPVAAPNGTVPHPPAVAQHHLRVASAQLPSSVRHARMRAMIAAVAAAALERLQAWCVAAASGNRWDARSLSALRSAPPIAARSWASHASATASAVTHVAMRCPAQAASGHLAHSLAVRARTQTLSPAARALAAHGTKLVFSTAGSPPAPSASLCRA